MTTPKYTKGKLVVDKCPDNNGYHTIRKADGSEHGDTSVQPIASAYAEANAARLAHCWNNYDSAIQALKEIESWQASLTNGWTMPKSEKTMLVQAVALARGDEKAGV